MHAIRQMVTPLLAGIFLVVGAPSVISQPATNDAAIADAMRQIGTRWTAAVKNGQWWESKCINNTVSLDRLAPTDRVSFDVRKTDSLLNPYIGIVSIDGIVESNDNSPQADGTFAVGPFRRLICFKTAAEAKNHLSPSDISPVLGGTVYHLEAYYHFDGSGVTLAGGNQVFENLVLGGISLPSNIGTWADLLHLQL